MSGSFSAISRFLFFFTKKLRLSSPWNYKVPFLICIPYFLFLLSGCNSGALASILASVCVILGIAGFGYLTNDLGDRHKDSIIGKENATAQLPVSSIVFLMALFIALAVAPWFYLPMDRRGLCLLVLQFALFYIYAFPPFRFKERGFLGVLADAGYAHVNPALLAAYTFYLFTGRSFAPFHRFVALLLAWQLVLGIRNIMVHQVKDHDKDIASGTRTFVTAFGVHQTEALLKKMLLPLEVLLFIAFCAFVTQSLNFFLPVIIVYWIFATIQLRQTVKAPGYLDYIYFYLDKLYLYWIPLIVLAALVTRSVHFVPVLVLHLLIFRTEVKTFFISLIHRLR